MKVYRPTSGPFAERPYYKEEEVESICIDELNKIGFLPSNPSPIRIDRFIEKKFNIDIDYGRDLPEAVLGLIEFGPDGVRRIAVSKSLSEEGSRIAERRINTTLAHEAGHGLLHVQLFIFGNSAVRLTD